MFRARFNIRLPLALAAFLIALPAFAGENCPAVMKQGGIFGAPTAPRENTVAGNYAESCKDCSTKGTRGTLPAWHLHASCAGKDGKFRKTVLTNASLCKPGTITNDDGRLRCECTGNFTLEGQSVRARLFLKGNNYFCEFK